MDYRALIYVLHIFTIVIAEYPVYPQIPCLAEKNRYYHKQLKKCRLCDKCLAGEETDLSVQVEVSDVFGALRCRPCIKCPKGMYNRRRAFKCKPCRNCTASGRTVKTACAPNMNEVCGRRILVNTNSTSKPSSVHPGKGDHGNGNTIPVVVIIILPFVGVIMIIGMVLSYLRGNNPHSTCPNNIIRDTYPIMTSSNGESTTSSVVSGIRHSYPQINHTRDGINNSFHATAFHQDNREAPDTEDQNTLHLTHSREQYRYTAIRQDERLSQLHTEDNNIELSSDYVPSSVMIDRPNSPALTTDAVQYAARTVVRSDLLYENVPYDEQTLVALSNNPTLATNAIQSRNSGIGVTGDLPPRDFLHEKQSSVAVYGDSQSANCQSKGKPKNELMEYVKTLSKYIATNDTYRNLGRHLNVSTTDIDIIVEDYDNVQERAYRTLMKWKQCNPNVNIDDLKKGICAIGRKDILDKIPS